MVIVASILALLIGFMIGIGVCAYMFVEGILTMVKKK